MSEQQRPRPLSSCLPREPSPVERCGYGTLITERWRVTAILDGSPLQADRWARLAVWLLDEADAVREIYLDRYEPANREHLQALGEQLEFLARTAVLRGVMTP